MKRKALKRRIDDLEQRVARLETLDDELSRDMLRLQGKVTKVKLTRFVLRKEKPHCPTCGECPHFPGNGNMCWQKGGYMTTVQADRPDCHDRGGKP